MGGLALLAREKKYQVSGCDENVYPPMSEILANEGINLVHGYNFTRSSRGRYIHHRERFFKR